ncbi:MAG: cell envelope protein [Shewanella sp. CG12_big_fil_rev_8_21_14_0_65_47_15]|nr:MAG: cell envelope protein [Shewanella sp. CG12_big_fil_rev_8_21_14_0_65_47_15]
MARVFSPQDKAIQTPNSDTPYSFLGADLRAEPLVISVPAIKDRYYSLQFIDMYTHNFAYVGSRATGTEAGSYLLAGPRWQGDVPEGVKSVIRSETELAFVLFRTQLFNDDDLVAVQKVQTQYRVQPLSRFLGTTPPPTPTLTFVKPLSVEDQKNAPEFFDILSFLLQFTPPHPSETALLARFAKVGIGAGKSFDVASLSPAERQAVTEGMADAWKAFTQYKAEIIDTGKKSSADGFGTREFLGNDYLLRMSSAVLGIYGNSKEEANYPVYFTDSEGKLLDGASNRYTLYFKADQLPPVNSFWSLTMYELPSSLLTENSLNRYLINSPMVPDLDRDPDGGITLYIQNESPGKEKEANWLPAPKGPFFLVLREYWPKPEALDGSWKTPKLVGTAISIQP